MCIAYLGTDGSEDAVRVQVPEVALKDRVATSVRRHVQHDGSHVRLALLKVALPEADVVAELSPQEEEAHHGNVENTEDVKPPVRAKKWYGVSILWQDGWGGVNGILKSYFKR